MQEDIAEIFLVSILFRASLNNFFSYFQMFFPPTSFHTFFMMFFTIPLHPFIKAQLLFFDFFSFKVIQKVLHNLGGVVSAISKKIVHTLWLIIHGLAF